MMKKLLLGMFAAVALGTNAGSAADLGRAYPKAPQVSAPVGAEALYNWTGFYLGGHLGGAFGGGNSLFSKNSRFLGGLQVGFDYQFAPSWVLGVEGQYSWLSGSDRVAHFSNFALTRNTKALGSIAGRLGYTWGPGLLYLKGGYAYQNTSYGVTSLGTPVAFAFDGKKSGYTIGAGLEYLFTPNWSGVVEYQYYDFGRGRFVGASPASLVRAGSFDNDMHSVKVGVNYRFK